MGARFDDLPHAQTPYRHIVVDDAGHPRIEGTRYKVVMLGLEHEEHGWSSTELKWQHPDLTLAQIHSALAYYFDHLEAMRTLADEGRALESEVRERDALPLSRQVLKLREA